MMENIQRRSKMEFPYYNCFPAFTKLIVGLHALHASKTKTNVLIVLNNRHFDASYLIVIPHVRYQKMCVKT